MTSSDLARQNARAHYPYTGWPTLIKFGMLIHGNWIFFLERKEILIKIQHIFKRWSKSRRYASLNRQNIHRQSLGTGFLSYRVGVCRSQKCCVCGAFPWIEILPDPVETYTSPDVIIPKLIGIGKTEWTYIGGPEKIFERTLWPSLLGWGRGLPTCVTLPNVVFCVKA